MHSVNVSIRLQGKVSELPAIDRYSCNKPLKSPVCAMTSMFNAFIILLNR